MLLTLALLLSLHAAPVDSLAGSWQIKATLQGNGEIEELCSFTQSGAVVGGRCDQDGEPAILTGDAKDGKLVFWHSGDWDGQAFTIVYTVTSQTPTQLKGTVEVRPFKATGTFTATRAATSTTADAKP